MNVKSESIAVFLLLAFSCTLPERLQLARENPTSYIFVASRDAVKQTIISKFDHGELNLSLFYWNSRFSKIRPEYFKDSVNKEDFYLDSTIPNKSHQYRKRGKGLDYVVAFQLKFISIDSTRTEVKVITLNPHVAVGKKLLPALPHLVRGDAYRKVKPSTIEEYEILLRIGRALQQEKMPPIVYPDK